MDEGGVGLHSRNGKIMHKAQRSKQQGMCGFHNPEGSIILKLKEPEIRPIPRTTAHTQHCMCPRQSSQGQKPDEAGAVILSSLRKGKGRPREAE